jgi:hypothetical protein
VSEALAPRLPSTRSTSQRVHSDARRPEQLETSLTPRGDGPSFGAVADRSSGRPSSAAALDPQSPAGASDVAGAERRLSADGKSDALSLGDGADVAAVPERQCLWCRGPLEQTPAIGPVGQWDGKRWCSKRCRQTAWRARKLAVVEDLGDTPKRLGYADPPYPGLSRKYYQHQPTYAGEVDHVALLSRMETFDGWALSTSAKALRDLLPLCPPEARVACWVKPNGAAPATRGLHNLWEPVIVMPARRRRPGIRDYLYAKPARGGGSLPGRKPLAFCLWLFSLLGASPVDELDDLFPGSGVVGNAWRQFCEQGRKVAANG